MSPTRGARIPAVTHVDCTARIQTIDRGDDPLMHATIARVRAAHRHAGGCQHQLQHL